MERAKNAGKAREASFIECSPSSCINAICELRGVETIYQLRPDTLPEWKKSGSRGRPSYAQGKPQSKAAHQSAAKVRKKPEEEREYGAEEQASNDGKVEGSVFATMDDVAGKFSETKGELAAEIKESAGESK
jgi:hypothetical protein